MCNFNEDIITWCIGFVSLYLFFSIIMHAFTSVKIIQ